MSSLGVAIIGAGVRGKAHAANWQMAGARVMVVNDLISSRAQDLASKYGAETTDGWEEAVRRPEVDVVSICTPTAARTEIALGAIAAGKHVLGEKPAALDVRDVDRMKKAASSAGVKLGFHFQRRFRSDVRELRRIVGAGELGRPVMINTLEASPIRAHKLAMHDLVHGNAGPVVDLCCHYFDGWSYVLDSPPVRVKAAGLTLGENRAELESIQHKAPDTATVTVEYASGDVTVTSISWGLPPGVNVPHMGIVLGPKGIGRMRSLRNGQYAIDLRFEGNTQEERVLPNEDLPCVGNRPEDQAIIRDFLGAIREGREPLTGAAEGRAALSVSVAAFLSMRTGDSIMIQDIGQGLPQDVLTALAVQR